MKLNWKGRSRLVEGVYRVHDCPKCNYHEIINWSRYCPWCGRRVKWDNAEELLEDEQYVEALKKVEGAVVRLFKRLINKGEDK